MKRGSIELAREICDEVSGELPDNEQYGSVDIAEILSRHVRFLEGRISDFRAELRRLQAVVGDEDFDIIESLLEGE